MGRQFISGGKSRPIAIKCMSWKSISELWLQLQRGCVGVFLRGSLPLEGSIIPDEYISFSTIYFYLYQGLLTCFIAISYEFADIFVVIVCSSLLFYFPCSPSLFRTLWHFPFRITCTAPPPAYPGNSLFLTFLVSAVTQNICYIRQLGARNFQWERILNVSSPSMVFFYFHPFT